MNIDRRGFIATLISSIAGYVMSYRQEKPVDDKLAEMMRVKEVIPTKTKTWRISRLVVEHIFDGNLFSVIEVSAIMVRIDAPQPSTKDNARHIGEQLMAEYANFDKCKISARNGLTLHSSDTAEAIDIVTRLMNSYIPKDFCRIIMSDTIVTKDKIERTIRAQEVGNRLLNMVYKGE